MFDNKEDSLLEKSTEILETCSLKEFLCFFKIKDKKNAILYSNYDIINSEGKIIKQFIEPDYNKLSTFDFNVILLDHHIGNGY